MIPRLLSVYQPIDRHCPRRSSHHQPGTVPAQLLPWYLLLLGLPTDTQSQLSFFLSFLLTFAGLSTCRRSGLVPCLPSLAASWVPGPGISGRPPAPPAFSFTVSFLFTWDLGPQEICLVPLVCPLMSLWEALTLRDPTKSNSPRIQPHL